MARIDDETEILTLINTFEVAPGKADELASLLVEATEDVIRHLDGFISANIHKSLDGRRIANYAQWKSKAHFDAMLQNSGAQVHIKKAAELAESFSPVLYDVVHASK